MDTRPAPPRRFATSAFLALLAVLFAVFAALGSWQVKRLHWKHDLIERVEARLHAEPVAAPAPAQWPAVDARSAEYRRVFLQGEFLPGRDTRVEALTALGPGDWILSPLRTDAGDVVLVNRGFVAADARDQVAPAPAGRVRVDGLVRLDEPGGRVLRENRPAEDRWYSRDIGAIAATRELGTVAPWFLDAAYEASAPPWPRGGMTVVRFRDHHLQYALTWFALAAMVAFAAWRLLSGERHARRRAHPPPVPNDAATRLPDPRAGPVQR